MSEAQAVLDPELQVTGCPFCRRIEQGAYRVTGVEGIVTFDPLNPVVPGHKLFVPVEHITDASENTAVAGLTMQAAASYVRFLRPREIQGANIITSIGSEATQTVFHLHLHVVPRESGDGLALPWS